MSGFSSLLQFYQITTMKLHLPKGLRAAVLAVVALVASTQTVSAAAASYEKLLSHLPTQTKTWLSNEASGGGGNFDFTYANGDPIMANSTDWVLNVGLYNISPDPDEITGDYLGATVLTNSGFIIDTDMDTLTLKVDNSQAILISPRGVVRLVVSGTRPDPKYEGNFLSEADVKLGNISSSWQKKYELDQTTINLSLSFAWDADGGKLIDGVQYGALKFLGGWIPDPNTGANVESIMNSKAGEIVLDSYALPEDFLSISNHNSNDATSMGGLYSFPGVHGTVILDLYTPGEESAWAITGTASLNDLLAGGYEDTTLDEPAGRAMQETDAVQFIGDAGTIYLQTPGDYTGDEPYKVVYSNPTTAEVDVRNGGSTRSIGFGADENAELTVACSVLESTIFSTTSQVPTGLRISGEGTVVLDLGDAARTVYLSSVGSASNLKLQTTSDVDAGVSLAATTLGANASIVRDKASEDGAGNGNLDVYLYDWQTPASKQALGRIENKVGGVNIKGISYSVDGSTVYYSYLKLDELKAKGDIIIESDATATGAIDAEGGITVNGQVDAAEVNSGSGITIGSASDDSCTLVATSAIVAAGNIDSYGSVGADTITSGGEVTVYNASDSANMLYSQEVTAASVTQTTIAGADSYDITITSAPADDTGSLSPLLTGDVVVNASGIVADEIGEGAVIKLDSETSGSVAARKAMTNATVEIGIDEVISGATSDASVTISNTQTVASGSLNATKVTLPEGYLISAGKLVVASSLEAGDTVITAAEGEAAVLDKVSAMGSDSATVGGITARTVQIGAGYILNNASISTSEGTTVGDGATLNNVSIEKGHFSNSGHVTLNNTRFGGGAVFGGAGTAITVGSYDLGVDSVQITGNFDSAALHVDRMVLNAERLVFEPSGNTYTVLSGDELAYAPSIDNYTLNIESFVRAALTFNPTTGEVSITGYKDEVGIKDELATTARRKATMAALDEVILDADADSPLAKINEYVGHVNRFSLEDRREVVDAVSGASVTALADSQRRGVQDVQKNLRNRIIQMGGGTNAGLVTDWDYVGLQAWAQADGSFISTDGSGDENGYDFNTYGATVGANVDLTANTVVGMSFSASYGELDVDSADNASGNNDAYYVSFFARHQKERWVQMFIFTMGSNDMELDRSVNLGANSYTGSGSTDGTTLSAYYEIGYTVGLNYEFTHVLQPMVSVSLTSAKVDGYTENGTIGNAGLTYDGDSYVYGTVSIGARYQGVLYETVHERNAVVEARALITQDFGDTTDEAMVGIGSSSLYSVKGADSTGTGFELGAGISLPVEQHTTLYADLDVTFRPDSTGVRANIGMRYDF